MKSTSNKRRFKIQRRLLTELPGLGKAGALERRPYFPGEHGQKRKKFSDYALRLEEKQKIMFNYNLKEEQLRRIVLEAKRVSKNKPWIESLSSLVERRIDSVLFRAGFAPSIRAASQMISHGKVLVNGKKLTIRSALVRVGSVVALTEKGYKGQDFLKSQQAPRLPLPAYLQIEESNQQPQIKLIDEPKLGDIPFQFDGSLFTEYYTNL